MTHREITTALEEHFPLSIQESWDNAGWQLGDPDDECRGVLICLDLTPAVLREAIDRGCNLVVSHHPLIFRGLKQITGRNRVERMVAEAFRRGISVYSSHTATDCAPAGVSYEMSRRLAMTDVEPLDESGLGVIGNLPQPLPWFNFITLVKAVFASRGLRCSRVPFPNWKISRVGLCGGSAGEFLPLALSRGAQAYVTAECKLNQFIDYADDILLVDAGHFETEECTKDLFLHVISEKFPNFAVWKSTKEQNPIEYI